jgi:glutathione-regulated potassium-efflux system ancillary protein KefG
MKVLVLYAHPAQQHSNVNAALAAVAKETEGVSFVDLYASYPRHNLDADVEQKRLLEHDAIIFQFPLMWYSTPPIMKEWQDIVLEYGFAYGENGDALKDKLWVTSVTAGSAEMSYGPDGHNDFNLRELLAPLEATAKLCKMPYIPPYALFASHKAAKTDGITKHAEGYRSLLESLRDDRFDVAQAREEMLLSYEDIAKLINGDKS